MTGKRHSVVVLPPSHDRSTAMPLIMLLHSAGGDAKTWRAVAADAGAILVLPRAVHRAGRHNWQWGDADESDIIVSRAMERLLAQHKVDPARSVIVGFSQGAVCALNAGLRHPEWFRGIIARAPYYDATTIPLML